MKKLPLLALVALSICSCSKDEPEPDNSLDKEAASIAFHLNGLFASSWQSLGTTQHEEFRFTPFSTPQKHDITIPGEYANIEKTVTTYGSCTHSVYYNEHLLETSNNYLYTVDVRYAGATPLLTLYPNSNGMIYGNYSEYNLRNVTTSSFEMLIEGNYHQFTKQ